MWKHLSILLRRLLLLDRLLAFFSEVVLWWLRKEFSLDDHSTNFLYLFPTRHRPLFDHLCSFPISLVVWLLYFLLFPSISPHHSSHPAETYWIAVNGEVDSYLARPGAGNVMWYSVQVPTDNWSTKGSGIGANFTCNSSRLSFHLFMLLLCVLSPYFVFNLLFLNLVPPMTRPFSRLS